MLLVGTTSLCYLLVMPKISISVPTDVLEFVDNLGDNRSGAIVAILQDYKQRRETDELKKAYRAYAGLREPDDALWEASAVRDADEES